MAERTVTTVETYDWDAKKSEWVKKSKTVTTSETQDEPSKVVPMPYPVYPQPVYPPSYPTYWRTISTGADTKWSYTVNNLAPTFDPKMVGQAISDANRSAYSPTLNA